MTEVLRLLKEEGCGSPTVWIVFGTRSNYRQVLLRIDIRQNVTFMSSDKNHGKGVCSCTHEGITRARSMFGRIKAISPVQ